ncbi:MAG: hypothetical protein PSX80_07465 [bacterium]|nr:hypothetical protein [bacterium]
MIIKQLCTLITASVFVAALVGISPRVTSAQQLKGTRTLVGTWQTVVTPRICATGAPLPATFPGILTFNEGGTMTGTSTAASSVYGVWERVHGPSEYSFSSISQRYSAAGVFLGNRRIDQNITIDESGDTFNSEGTFVDTDPAGSSTTNGCSSSTGVRFR